MWLSPLSLCAGVAGGGGGVGAGAAGADPVHAAPAVARVLAAGAGQPVLVESVLSVLQ